MLKTGVSENWFSYTFLMYLIDLSQPIYSNGGFKFEVQHIANSPLLHKDQGVDTSGGVKGKRHMWRGLAALDPARSIDQT